MSDETSLKDVEVLTFDVFGTVIDWHGSIVKEMKSRAQKPASPEIKKFSDGGQRIVSRINQRRDSLRVLFFICQTGQISLMNGEMVSGNHCRSLLSSCL